MKKLAIMIAILCMPTLALGVLVPPDPGGRDGWLVDTSNGDLITMRAGTVVMRISSAGALTTIGGLTFAGDLTLENGETIKNDNNGEIEFGDTVEDLALAFGTNSALWSSDTGVLTWDWTQITTLILGNDETIKNDNNGEIEFGDAVEDTAFSWGTNSIILSSDTGVVEMDGGDVWTTMTFQNDATLGTGVANKLTWTENSEDWTQEFTTNEIVHSTSTGVTRHDFEAIGLRTTVPLFPIGRTIRFCGQASNAATSVFMPPIDEFQNSGATDMSSFSFGGGGCDGAENTTETNGDGIAIGTGGLTIEVHGMKCGISAAGTDDVYTLQLRDDQSDVTGVTCNWTLDGSAKECEVLLDAPVTVVAGSLLAIQSEAATNDDVSSADLECVVFYSY